MTQDKPLGMKAYGHIGHLPGSRVGEGDHHVHEGQARICTEKVRDRHDTILVQEKLDGSCVAVARIDGAILPLNRAGYRAESSPYEHHRLFADWVYAHWPIFYRVLRDGERLVGEWLALAHGTRYDLPHEPFAVFDLMTGHRRATLAQFMDRLDGSFTTPAILHAGGPLSIAEAQAILGRSRHGALDPVEGAVWRVERNGEVDFLAKWVRPDKVDGCYLPEVSGMGPVWNWPPESLRSLAAAK